MRYSTLILTLIILHTFIYGLENRKESCTELNLILNLDLKISDVKIYEDSCGSKEAFTSSKTSFGYGKYGVNINDSIDASKILEQIENTIQPLYFQQYIDSFLFQKEYFYELPDSNVYAIIYEFENFHGGLGGTYPGNTFNMNTMPSKKYLKCQFESLTNTIEKIYGEHKESENFGIVREWIFEDKVIHLNLTLGTKSHRRLRLVVYEN